MSTIKLNTLPAPTFSWLGVNDIQADVQPFPEEVTFLENGSCTQVTSGGAYEISAQDGNTLDAVMFISPENNAQIKTQVTVGSGSAVRLVQIFESSAQTAAGVYAVLAENARFELVQLYLKTADTISEVNTQLEGRKAGFTANIGYLLGGSDRLDINLVARHLGRKTRSEINAKGVLDKNSRKTFKGTIDFVGGCAGASGAESEDTLLIGDKTVNKTVPLILCAEEDVEGSHGASIGRVDENHIFYMQSRGLPEEKIIQLMARSKIAQIISTISDEDLRERLNDMLLRGNENE